ncbi:hypothetical protein GCM10018965_039580 [Nonomuraea roseola]
MFVHEEHQDADETLLFLHGGNVAGWMWRDLAASLPDQPDPGPARFRRVER